MSGPEPSFRIIEEGAPDDGGQDETAHEIEGMYPVFYGLRGRPFKLTPDSRFFFGSRPHKKAMAYLTYGLSEEEGFIVITGEIGAGKTTLIDYLFSQINRGKFIAAKVVTTQLDADDVLRMVAAGFGIRCEGADKAAVLTEIENFLVTSRAAGKRLLLVVDEIQNLPTRSLEELRMLSNFQRDGEPLLQIYLVGQPQFRRALAGDSMEQLRQRVVASYHLEALDAEQTRQYIEHRLGLVGWQRDPEFTAGAHARIYAHSGGIPRKINLLCERLLLFGCLEDKHLLGEDDVDEVISDLDGEGTRFQPTPTLGGSAGGAQGTELAAAATLAIARGVARLSKRVFRLEKRLKSQERKLTRAVEDSTPAGRPDTRQNDLF